jgi:hypothetical protein
MCSIADQFAGSYSALPETCRSRTERCDSDDLEALSMKKATRACYPAMDNTIAGPPHPPWKSFSLIDCISVDVDRIQRNFEPMRKQVGAWQRSELRDRPVS